MGLNKYFDLIVGSQRYNEIKTSPRYASINVSTVLTYNIMKQYL